MLTSSWFFSGMERMTFATTFCPSLTKFRMFLIHVPLISEMWQYA